jgi:tRNA A-37 threonylcarbamoyl transferase component Bud32
MEFVGDIVRKTGESNLLAVEAAKTSRAYEIAKDSGLFSVPKVISFDADTGVLEFERLNGLVTLLDLAVRRDRRLHELLGKTGQALGIIHRDLTLSEDMKHELPPGWMAATDENVFIHGDFACINVCFHEPSGNLVILDWSAAPMVGGTPTYGSRYFDILLFVSSVFHGAPYRRILNWGAKAMADTFLKGYCESSAEVKLNDLKSYSSKICRLQRENIRHLARQRRPLRAVAYVSCQTVMHARFCRFLRRHGSPS